jgi:hypothetical protein
MNFSLVHVGGSETPYQESHFHAQELHMAKGIPHTIKNDLILALASNKTSNPPPDPTGKVAL